MMHPRSLAAGALFGLATWVALWHGVLVPPRGAAAPVAALLSTLPLLAAIALWLRRPRIGLLAGALVGLGYFAHGLMTLLTERALRPHGLVEVMFYGILLGALGAATAAERRARKQSPPT